MKHPVGQIAYFRVYPEPKRSRLHFKVRIFTSQRAMREYLRASELPRSLGRYGRAMCSTWDRVTVGKTMRKHPEMGEMVFPVSHLGMEAIAHECTHAALGWAKRIALNPVVDGVPSRLGSRACAVDEERFCYALGQMGRQISSQIWKRGLYK